MKYFVVLCLRENRQV